MPTQTIRHFGVLIPSTNTTVETEYTRLLPAAWQPHYARVKSASIDGSPFSPPLDEDVEYQSKMLGTAKVEIVMLIQTSASLFSEDYDDKAMRLMQGAGVPGFTSAMAIGEALQRARHEADRAGLALFGESDRQRPALLRGTLRAVGRRARRLRRDRFLHDRPARAGDGARRVRPHRPARDRGVCRARRQFPDHGVDRGLGRRNSASRSSRPTRPRCGACCQRLGSEDRMPGLGRLLAIDLVRQGRAGRFRTGPEEKFDGLREPKKTAFSLTWVCSAGNLAPHTGFFVRGLGQQGGVQLTALLVVSPRISRRRERDGSMKRQNRLFSKLIARAAVRVRRNRSTKR